MMWHILRIWWRWRRESPSITKRCQVYIALAHEGWLYDGTSRQWIPAGINMGDPLFFMRSTSTNVNEGNRWRLELQIWLGEYLLESGFDLTNSNSWALQVIAGRPSCLLAVTIVADISRGQWSISPVGSPTITKVVAWYVPVDEFVELLRRFTIFDFRGS